MGFFTRAHTEMPPDGTSHASTSPSFASRRRTRKSRRARYTPRIFRTWRCSSPSSSSSATVASIGWSPWRSITARSRTSRSASAVGATTKPSRSPGASTFESVPIDATTPASSALASGSTGRPS